jgi:hypothetical protein
VVFICQKYVDVIEQKAYSVGTVWPAQYAQEMGHFVMTQYLQSESNQNHAPLLRRLMNNSSGAAIALMGLLHHKRNLGDPIGEEIEQCLMMLDTLGICGDDLCTLWFDICHHDVAEVTSFLRACHEEYCGVSYGMIRQAITCCRQGIVAPLGEQQLVLEVPGL